MMLERGSLTSYALYGGTALTAGAINKNVSPMTPSAGYVPTVNEVPLWLQNLAPDMVATGAVAVKDGSIFLYGLGVLEMFSLVAIMVTLVFTAGKFWMDAMSFRANRRKLAALEEAGKPCPECGYSSDD